MSDNSQPICRWAMLPHWLTVGLMGLLVPLLTAWTKKPGEFYPFSNFLMYSSFEPETYYVFVTDGADKPVAIGRVFGVASSDVKKTFDAKLKEAKAKAGGKVRKSELPLETQAQAGGEVLLWLKGVSPVDQREGIAKLGALRLHRVDLLFANGALTKKARQVGEVRW